MITADAVMHGDRDRLLGFDPVEHPVAVQLGGSDPARLADAAEIAAGFGYDEINLNIGCPSDRVQAGTFGACLMRDPELVGRLVAEMKSAVAVPVTVKCRLGVDEQDTEIALDALADAVVGAGCDGLWVHARKAWLAGLSAKENRNVPPLDHERVGRLKGRLPDCFVGTNGGIADTRQVVELLARVDGVMVGRAAYRHPEFLVAVDRTLAGRESRAGKAESPEPAGEIGWSAVIDTMMDYAARHVAAGGRLSSVTRHMIGLFAGQPGARRWRQILTEEACRPGAGPQVIQRAFAAIEQVPGSGARQMAGAGTAVPQGAI